MKINWTTNPDASCWHALLAAERRLPLVDEKLAAKLGSIAYQRAALQQHAAAAIADGVEPAEPSIVEAFDRCRRVLIGEDRTSFAESLGLRSGPLREQWDARGPGLMRQIGKLTEPLTALAAPQVALVTPVVGGHGEALPEAGAVTLEAVLANPEASLPEVLRLAWLLAQLAAPNTDGAVPLALVPAVLAAGEEVELTRFDSPTLELALSTWHATENPISDAATLFPWWTEYRQSLTPWTTAVADLQQRLA